MSKRVVLVYQTGIAAKDASETWFATRLDLIEPKGMRGRLGNSAEEAENNFFDSYPESAGTKVRFGKMENLPR